VIVIVLGASGRTGSYVASHLFAAEHTVFALVRDPDRSQAVKRLGRLSHPTAGPGVQPVVGDLLGDPDRLVELFRGCDAVVNAAGGTDLVATDAVVDREGAMAAIDAAGRAGVRRFVQISSMYADRPDEGPQALQALLRAKSESDTALITSGLDWTVIRPGGLDDSVLTGQIRAGRRLAESGSIPREDVAAVAATCLSWPTSIGLAFDVVGGKTPILEALARLAPVTD